MMNRILDQIFRQLDQWLFMTNATRWNLYTSSPIGNLCVREREPEGRAGNGGVDKEVMGVKTTLPVKEYFDILGSALTQQEMRIQ